MKLALIQPCIGRYVDRPYIRTWQMEPLSLATLAAATPGDVDVVLYDDRLEPIPFDAPVDAVAISVETYTARRAYQLASDFRARGVPVIMGGFHASLCPDEVAEYADAVVVGEADRIWPEVIDDVRHGRLQERYRALGRVPLAGLQADRSVFAGKRYLPIGLVEASRGCRFGCEFCAISSFYGATFAWRPVDEVVAEMVRVGRERKLIFLVDDNLAGDLDHARELLAAMAGERLSWVGQCSVNAARDEDFTALLARSGCRAVLIGFESLDAANLAVMNKRFNAGEHGYEAALANLARHRIAVYGTFVFGYDHDTERSFARAVDFAVRHRFFIAAFNHVVPFPGTPLYARLAAEGRLLHERWWLEPSYRFNELAFRPARLEPQRLRALCLEARRSFYALPAILRRATGRANRRPGFALKNYWPINLLHRAEVDRRDNHPLGDLGWRGSWRPVAGRERASCG